MCASFRIASVFELDDVYDFGINLIEYHDHDRNGYNLKSEIIAIRVVSPASSPQQNRNTGEKHIPPIIAFLPCVVHFVVRGTFEISVT